ncbi:hypothetical protein [Methanobrevibacter sp.]|uniref:hypothetical protein n=1 Tax=Methanobrevibacter sp. TaxID=66852 RepID=UPI0025D29ED0|nr:hypothetical protein [Methanobrevibacter sp.]MBR4448304.1 hypothetical protein [Methanobrevibacter sp.]
MNRKILAIFALLIVAISISTVSAFGLDDLIGSSSEAENVTIDGIDFNIPAGFVEDEDMAVNGEVNESQGIEYTTWGKTYANDENDVISIGVATYDGVEVDDSIPAYIGGDKLSVNGVDGYDYNVPPFEGFTYAKDGKLVIISVTDDALLKDIVIK